LKDLVFMVYLQDFPSKYIYMPIEIIHKIYELAILDYETIYKQAPMTIVRMQQSRSAISYSEWNKYCIKAYGYCF